MQRIGSRLRTLRSRLAPFDAATIGRGLLQRNDCSVAVGKIPEALQWYACEQPAPAHETCDGALFNRHEGGGLLHLGTRVALVICGRL